MEACEVVRLFVNKMVVPAERRRRGNPGYGRLKALRVLVYSRLKGLENDTRIVKHVRKHRQAIRSLGLPSVPDRTTVGRWSRAEPRLLTIMYRMQTVKLKLCISAVYIFEM
jgi:hypothetical protein